MSALSGALGLQQLYKHPLESCTATSRVPLPHAAAGCARGQHPPFQPRLRLQDMPAAQRCGGGPAPHGSLPRPFAALQVPCSHLNARCPMPADAEEAAALVAPPNAAGGSAGGPPPAAAAAGGPLVLGGAAPLSTPAFVASRRVLLVYRSPDPVQKATSAVCVLWVQGSRGPGWLKCWAAGAGAERALLSPPHPLARVLMPAGGARRPWWHSVQAPVAASSAQVRRRAGCRAAAAPQSCTQQCASPGTPCCRSGLGGPAVCAAVHPCPASAAGGLVCGGADRLCSPGCSLRPPAQAWPGVGGGRRLWAGPGACCAA